MSHEDVPSTPEIEFARLVRTAREQRGWSQDELARQLKAAGTPIHQTGLHRMETGDRGVRLNEAVAIAKLLGLDLRIFSPHGGQPAITSDEEAATTQSALDELGKQEEELKSKLAQLHSDYDAEIAVISASLQLLATSRILYSKALNDYAEARDGDR